MSSSGYFVHRLFIGSELPRGRDFSKWNCAATRQEVRDFLAQFGVPREVFITDTAGITVTMECLVDITTWDIRAGEKLLRHGDILFENQCSDPVNAETAARYIDDYQHYSEQNFAEGLNVWRLLVDDERWPPRDGQKWKIARNLADAQLLIDRHGMPMFVSFDHDLGEGVETGKDIAEAMVWRDLDATRDQDRFPEGFSYYVHSQNTTGKANIEGFLSGYFRHRQHLRS